MFLISHQTVPAGDRELADLTVKLGSLSKRLEKARLKVAIEI